MPRTWAERLAEATRLLVATSESPRLDAEILLAHALGIPRSKLLADLNRSLDAPGFDALVERRHAHEPVAYILGEWEFFSLPVYTQPPIFVPRPETEHLVEAALDFIGQGPALVLELGVGTGGVSLAVAVNAPLARVVATDINPAAVELARRNAKRHNVEERVEFREGDLFDALRPDEPPFDVVCSNPPYIEDGELAGLAPDIRLYEDHRALTSGADGLDIVRRISAGALARLRPGGLLALEIGMGQYVGVASILSRGGYEGIGYRLDLAGIKRIVTACAPRIR